MAARGLSFPEWLTHWPSQPPQPKAQLAGFLGIQIQKLSLFVSIFNQGQSSCGHLSIWIYWLRQGSSRHRAATAGIAAMRSTKPSLQHQQHVLLLLDTVHYGQCTAVQCTFNHNFLQMDPFSNLPPYCPVSSLFQSAKVSYENQVGFAGKKLDSFFSYSVLWPLKMKSFYNIMEFDVERLGYGLCRTFDEQFGCYSQFFPRDLCNLVSSPNGFKVVFFHVKSHALEVDCVTFQEKVD